MLLFFLPFLACDYDSIAEIKADPAQFESKVVRIGGLVTQQYVILNHSIYEIADQSGRIFVISEKGLPWRGAAVEVKGTVEPSFRLATKDFGAVILEQSRRVR